MHPTLSDLKQWFDRHKAQVHKDFFTFLSFPSISTDTKHRKDCLHTAKWLADYLKAMGLEPEIWETAGLPIVFASHLKAGPNRPTLLIYHHYDVQPADPLDQWHSDPFKPTVKDNKVYARGALDNKGQCFYSLTAVKAFLEMAKNAHLNIKVFIEGEEEVGGEGTLEMIPKKSKELKADHLLIIDADIPEEGIPGITLGLRGLVAMEIDFINSSVDLHSGGCGGIALNPNRALVDLLSKLWTPSGKVAVPHFYDDVLPVSKEELALYDTSATEERFRESFGIRAFAPEPGFTIAESNMIRPTVEINGISGGYSGEGFKTVIPAKAHVKLSCRLVPNQDSHKIEKLVSDFLHRHVMKGIELKINLHHGGGAYRTSPNSPIAKLAKKVYEEIFKKPCRLMLSGGSIGVTPVLEKASGAKVVMMGMGLEEDCIHAPNEHFGLDRFEQGFLVMGRILSQLAEEG